MADSLLALSKNATAAEMTTILSQSTKLISASPNSITLTAQEAFVDIAKKLVETGTMDESATTNTLLLAGTLSLAPRYWKPDCNRTALVRFSSAVYFSNFISFSASCFIFL